MRKIEISEEVWQEIADRGKFGETEDDVLRRIFGLKEDLNYKNEAIKIRNRSSRLPRRSLATKRLSSYLNGNNLILIFEDGTSQSWKLPDRNDKMEIRKIRDEAVNFAKNNGATSGQINAVKKTLTEAGYHIIK